MLQTNYLHEKFEQIDAAGWALISLPIEFGLQLLTTAQNKFETGAFKPAVVTNALTASPSNLIRHDMTYWINDHSTDPAEQRLFSFLNQLKNELSHFFRFSLTHFECHYALYQPGKFYQRHSDQTKENNQRFFSFVIYLNENWLSVNEGALRGFVNESDVVLFKVHPEIGQMILFKSEIEHEVLAANRQRWSLTGWFRR